MLENASLAKQRSIHNVSILILPDGLDNEPALEQVSLIWLSLLLFEVANLPFDRYGSPLWLAIQCIDERVRCGSCHMVLRAQRHISYTS